MEGKMDNIEKIEEMFKYDLTMKMEELGKVLPSVREYIAEEIEANVYENQSNEKELELFQEQKYFMENTLSSIRNRIGYHRRNSTDELKKLKKAELLELLFRIVSDMDECMADF